MVVRGLFVCFFFFWEDVGIGGFCFFWFGLMERGGGRGREMKRMVFRGGLLGGDRVSV